MWNLSIPARLKAYIDIIVIAGKTFKYTENGAIGLLSGKKGVHIQARGGFYSTGEMVNFEFGDRYIESIFGFMGIQMLEPIIAEGMAYDPSQAENIAQKTVEHAEHTAQEFVQALSVKA